MTDPRRSAVGTGRTGVIQSRRGACDPEADPARQQPQPPGCARRGARAPAVSAWRWVRPSSAGADTTRCASDPQPGHGAGARHCAIGRIAAKGPQAAQA